MDKNIRDFIGDLCFILGGFMMGYGIGGLVTLKKDDKFIKECQEALQKSENDSSFKKIQISQEEISPEIKERIIKNSSGTWPMKLNGHFNKADTSKETISKINKFKDEYMPSEHVDFENLIKNEGVDNEVDINKVLDKYTSSAEDNDFKKPKSRFVEITENDFLNNDSYDKCSCTYYEGDGKLIDESSGVELSIAESVGKLAIRRINGENPTTWVRNTRLGIDYELVWAAGPYDIDLSGDEADI